MVFIFTAFKTVGLVVLVFLVGTLAGILTGFIV
jgi:hypothetical protein